MSNSQPPDHTPEKQAAPSEDTSFADVLSEFERQRPAEAGPREALHGTVVAVSAESVFVDIGLKQEGMLPIEELLDASGSPRVKAGDPLTVSVTGRSQEGYYLLSTLNVKRPTDWSALEEAYAGQSVIGGVVSEVIKGGLRVDVGVRAFLPASRSGAADAAGMEALVGQEIRCKIIQLDTAKEDVVVDRRVVLAEEEAGARQRAFAELKEGAAVSGTVRSLTDFGAFIDLGGIDGLLHVTDMSWGRVNKPSDLLSVGDPVEIQVLKIDPEAHRISLGRKQLLPDPWVAVADKYKVGEKVRGPVVRVTDFGAFVELEPGVDGLIHISDMSWSRKVRKPADAVKRGETVEVVVLSVNAEERRIALGLKQALGDPWEDIDKRFPVGSVVEGVVSNLAKFGAFVELGDGIEGMIHVGDITREKRLNHPREALSGGEKVRAAVLAIDRDRKRIRLGVKQLEPTTADEYIAEHKPGDVVTGRLVEVGKGSARVELADGVMASCRIEAKEAKPAENKPDSAKLDLSAMTAMLAAKWKQGASPHTAARRGAARAGQVLSFRILSLDPAQKRIEIELAG